MKKKILFWALIFFCPTLALATEPSDTESYQIELVVFSHVNATGLNSEQWPIYNNPKPDLEGVKDVGGDNMDNYPLIPDNQYRLSRIVNKLKQSGDYQVLLHLGWRESLDQLSRADTPWVHIYGGRGFNDQGNPITSSLDESIPYNDATHWELDGLVHIDLNRYFNTQYDLFLAEPLSQIQALSTNTHFSNITDPSQLVYFQLQQKRRMRSTELNYLGHPLYGVLIDIHKIHDSS